MTSSRFLSPAARLQQRLGVKPRHLVGAMCAVALACLVPLAARGAQPDLVPPPLPGPKPPIAAPAPPPIATRVLPLAETISDAQARLELARALSYLKRYGESLREFEHVLADKPADNAVRAEYAQVLFWSGRGPEAYAILAKIPAAELTPELRLALADLSVGQGKFDDAAALYAERVKAAPDDLATRFKLAEVLSWLKRYDESLALYRELLAARPADVQLRRRYALVLMWAGRLDAAAAELRATLPGS